MQMSHRHTSHIKYIGRIGIFHYRRVFFALLALVACLFLVPASAENIHEYHLKNGLSIIVKEDHRAPVVLFSVWYRVGGSYEHEGITGISHVLEHMMFRGSKHYPAGMLEKLMSENGGDQNAMTENDRTGYYERISSDKLPLCFQLESDRMQNLLLNKSDFDKEIQVVMEERRMRFDDDPMALTYERLMAAAFVNSPYQHQAIGWMPDLKHMTIDDVREWYQNWYAPNNATLVIVGDVNPATVLSLANTYFGPIPKRALTVPKPRNEVPPLGTKEITVNLPAKLPMIYMAYQVPSLKTAEKPWQPYALDVLNTLLGGSDSSRFVRELVREHAIATVAQTMYDMTSLHTTQFILIGVPAAGHTIDDIKTAFSQQLLTLQKSLISAEELDRVKAEVIAEKVYQKDSLINQAIDIGDAESIGLSWRIPESYVEQIQKITPEEVQAVAKLFLVPERLTIAVLHPTGIIPKPKSSEKILPSGLH